MYLGPTRGNLVQLTLYVLWRLGVCGFVWVSVLGHKLSRLLQDGARQSLDHCEYSKVGNERLAFQD